MTLFIFVGDMLVMAFMVGVAIWFGTSGTSESALAGLLRTIVSCERESNARRPT